MSVSVSDNNQDFLRLQEIAKLKKAYTTVGFHAEDGKYEKSSEEEEDEEEAATVLEKAVANEFGVRTPKRYIPARPFVRTAYDEHKDKIAKAAKKLYSEVIDGKETAANAISLLGEIMQTEIEKKIDSIMEPPNAPSTIAKKKSSKPLVGITGQMRQSVHHVEVIE